MVFQRTKGVHQSPAIEFCAEGVPEPPVTDESLAFLKPSTRRDVLPQDPLPRTLEGYYRTTENPRTKGDLR